jgi:predicted alpha/beta-hydrolase family hydrolase
VPIEDRRGEHGRDIDIPPLGLPGTIHVPPGPRGVILIAHAGGVGGFTPLSLRIVEAFAARGLATVRFDLLTGDERERHALVFDTTILAERLVGAVQFTRECSDLAPLPFGLFGAGSGAGAALIAATRLADEVRALVCLGGRADLVGEALRRVQAPTLIILGESSHATIGLAQRALAQMRCEKALKIVPGALHMFPKPTAVDTVVAMAAQWFDWGLAAPSGSA